MQAVTVVPGTAGSTRLDDVAEPSAALGSVLVETLAIGVCGTDAEIPLTHGAVRTRRRSRLQQGSDEC
jgi:threonine dehydrogenase-like Zn-dependent dehydrogenase